MSNTYQIYLISDSTGETLDRIFLALKAQFLNIKYKVHSYSFTRTENQILKILEEAEKNSNAIILYTIVDNNLAKYLANVSENKKIPCFGVLGNLILNFSKILNQKASHEPSGQHELNEEYYERIEAIQFTMNHDDGNSINDIEKSDIILVGVSRTSKTPTSMYLANRGYKTANIPLVLDQKIPDKLKSKNNKTCIIGLVTDPERLADVRRNRVTIMKENNIKYIVADWTNKNQSILKALESYNRNGVPLYIFWKPGMSRSEILPAILTEQILLDTFENDIITD